LNAWEFQSDLKTNQRFHKRGFNFHMIKVSCQMKVHEVDGKNTPGIGGPRVTLNSGSIPQLVEIEFEGKRFSVVLEDLRSAIEIIEVSGG